MDINLSDIKDVAVIAKPFIDPIVNALISPKVKQLEKWLKRQKTNNDVVEDFFENKFKDYLLRTYQKLSSLNILVFPNQQVNIKAIYYPLTIRSTKDRKKIQIEKFDASCIEPYHRMLISDTAGMGKSTLSKWIGLSLIEQNLSIPILIELKRLNNKHLILDEIYNQIDPIDKSFDKDLIIRFLELGNFTILLDGFDEIQYEHREYVILDLKDFISKCINNWFILTSRPDSSLTAFGDFQLFHIQPLRQHESFDLLRKYDNVSNSKISEQLIKDIQDRNPQVNEFLENPFLVSLLYKTYTYNKDIPSKKSSFYDEVYGALYKHHDLSKDGFKRNKKSELDIQDFRQVLRQLAFDTAKAVVVEYNEQQLIKLVNEAKQKCIGIDFKETNFIEDLESSVPLFVRDGSVLKWAHKSLQDYFAAEFISSSKDKEKIIDLIFKSGKDNYLNILDFLYEIEYKVFRKIIIKKILIDYISFCETSYKSIKGVEESVIKERQAVSFGMTYGFFIGSKKELEFEEAAIRFNSTNSNNRTLSRSLQKRGHVYQLFTYSPVEDIIDILAARNEDIFLEEPITPLDGYSLILSFDREDVVFLNEEPENFINIPSQFADFTRVIISEGIRSIENAQHFLDYNKCKALLKKIIEEEKFDEEKDVLDGI